MPVLDHPIHDKVKHDKPPSGCFNRRWMQDSYFVLVRKYDDLGRYKLVSQKVEHTMSTKCRQINNLPECEGCTAEKDVEYIERMMQL